MDLFFLGWIIGMASFVVMFFSVAGLREWLDERRRRLQDRDEIWG